MRASYDLFRRLQLRASLPEADHDGCALCGYEPGKKVCGACNQSLQRIKQPLRAEIYAHLVSIGDKARADALKRTVNVFKPESKAGRALATLRKRSGCNQKQFAAALGISQPTLSKIEKTGTGPLERIRSRLAHLVKKHGDAMPASERKTLCNWANIPNPCPPTTPGIKAPESRINTGPENAISADRGEAVTA